MHSTVADWCPACPKQQSQPVLLCLCTGHNILWYGISLCPVWVSCPGSQQCTCSLAEHGRAKSPWFRVSSSQHQPKHRCYQHYSYINSKQAPCQLLRRKLTLSQLKPGQALKGKQQQAGAVPAGRRERSTLSLAPAGFGLNLIQTYFIPSCH